MSVEVASNVNITVSMYKTHYMYRAVYLRSASLQPGTGQVAQSAYMSCYVKIPL